MLETECKEQITFDDLPPPPRKAPQQGIDNTQLNTQKSTADVAVNTDQVICKTNPNIASITSTKYSTGYAGTHLTPAVIQYFVHGTQSQSQMQEDNENREIIDDGDVTIVDFDNNKFSFAFLKFSLSFTNSIFW